MNEFLTMAMGSILLIHGFFIMAVIKKDLSVIDTAWGLGFILIALIGCFLSEWNNTRETVIFIMVLCWGLRLAAFIFSRNHGKPEDFRYASYRQKWGSQTNLIAYFKIYWIQILLMLVVSFPIFVGHKHPTTPLHWINFVGVFLWMIGFAWEATADFQKSQFKKDPKNKSRVLQKGLWSLSRHPNYFGEALLWWGISLVSFHPHHYLGFIGAIFITFLLCKVTGIPLIEAKQKDNPEYQAYMRNTPQFIPALNKLMKIGL